MTANEHLAALIKKAAYISLPSNTSEEHLRIFTNYLIAHGVTVQEWISVKERLPTREDANETESILAINKDEKYVGRWVWDIVARWPTEFTYWMPLPEPPKGE